MMYKQALDDHIDVIMALVNDGNMVVLNNDGLYIAIATF